MTVQNTVLFCKVAWDKLTTGVYQRYVLLSFLSPFKNAHSAFLFDCMIQKYVWNISTESINTVHIFERRQKR